MQQVEDDDAFSVVSYLSVYLSNDDTVKHQSGETFDNPIERI